MRAARPNPSGRGSARYFPVARRDGGEGTCEHSRCSILNGILDIIRTGGSWRRIPHDLPHRKTFYHDFRLWAKQRHWQQIHHAIRDLDRLKVGKRCPDRCDPRSPKRSHSEPTRTSWL
ncbi:transposase [Haloferula luteola]|uniref:transposase n=1 Tax=Haloferula luteola TaxID=595692 RepID=UPI00161D130F